MATLIFLLIWFITTSLPIIIFDLYTLEFINLLFILGAGLLGFVVAFVLLALSMVFYGRFQKEIDPFNMKNHLYINSMMRLIIRILRIKLVVTGEEHIPKDQNFIVVSNHQENYDIVFLKQVFKDKPMLFIAKESLFNKPVIGRMIRLLGNISIRREDDRSAVESIIKGIKLYKQGAIVSIFPEGTRSRSQTMGPFKAGAFKLAMKPKADILVTTIHNASNVWKGWPFKRQTVHLHFHPLLTYNEYEMMNTQTLSNHVRTMIESSLKRLETD